MTTLKHRAVGRLGAGLVHTLFRTVRATRAGGEHLDEFRRQGRPVILVCWHGQLLPLVYVHRGQGIVLLVSEHGDGEFLTQVAERIGYGTVRGSSTRGGARGLKALVRAAAEGRDLALTPDGPRGPYGVFKPGALVAAQLTGAPVIPVAVGASAAWRLGSWDGFMIPKPFARMDVEYLAPRFVPRNADRDALDAIASEIGGELNALTARLNPDGWRPPEPRAS